MTGVPWRRCLLLLAACLLSVAAALAASAPLPNATLPASSFSLSPADRWGPRTINGNATIFLSKWGGASAVIASLVNATEPPTPRAVGLLYGTGSSNGFARVSVNGAIVADLDTFSPTTNYTNELYVPLERPLPNLPLWVVAVEATGLWTNGSKDSYIEIVGLNVYY